MIRLTPHFSSAGRLVVLAAMLLAGAFDLRAQPSNSPGVLAEPAAAEDATNAVSPAKLDRINYL